MVKTCLSAQEILKSVKNVPALSPGAGQLMGILGSGRYEIADVVRVIENDPALTVNVLRVVNSAAMGLRREIDSVQQAVAYLGETKIIGIALVSSGGATFNADLVGYQGDRGMLGRHSLWVAIAARELSRYTEGAVDGGVAFTAGLLHDIGKAVISDYMVERVPEILQAVEAEAETEADHLGAERSIIGVDHCEVGKALAQHWGMPESLLMGLEYHHDPAEAPEKSRPLAYIIHLADMLAMMQGVGTGVDDMRYKFDGKYEEYVKIGPSALEGLVLDVQIDYRATAKALFGNNEENTE